MPSRTVMLAVAAFWLATLGWTVYRDRLPGENPPPPFQFELMDEVGNNVGVNKLVHWEVYFQDQEQKGIRCETKMTYKSPRMFELACDYHFPESKNWPFGNLTISKLQSRYWVAAVHREIVGLSATFESTRPNFQFRGEVRADAWSQQPPWKLVPQEGNRPPLAEVPSLRAAWNPMHPRATLPGLALGRTWNATVMDPLENARHHAKTPHYVHTESWQAQVYEEPLHWKEKFYSIPRGNRFKKSRNMVVTIQEIDYPCWRVDFTDAAGRVRASIWVRQEDDWVLQQQVEYPEGVLKLVRQTGKKL